MYSLINNHIQEIIGSIQNTHITDYDWLVQNIQQVADPEYQNRYKNYWRLNAARLSQKYCQAYFQHLQKGLDATPPQLDVLANQLYQTPTHGNGRQSLQFSFCSKLCHMLDGQLPIYDAMIRDFYFFTEPRRNLAIPQRITTYLKFYQFLINEYNRILDQRLLGPSIQAFRNHFNPQDFTDIKVIDSLIWAFVSLQRNSIAGNRAVIYY
jgi:hypothetical protein